MALLPALPGSRGAHASAAEARAVTPAAAPDPRTVPARPAAAPEARPAPAPPRPTSLTLAPAARWGGGYGTIIAEPTPRVFPLYERVGLLPPRRGPALEEALRRAQAQVGWCQTVLGEDHLGTAQAYLALAQLALRAGQLDAADAALREALQRLERRPAEAPVDLWDALLTREIALRLRGRGAEAEEAARAAEVHQRRRGLDPAVAVAARGRGSYPRLLLGALYLQAGAPERALPLLEPLRLVAPLPESLSQLAQTLGPAGLSGVAGPAGMALPGMQGPPAPLAQGSTSVLSEELRGRAALHDLYALALFAHGELAAAEELQRRVIQLLQQSGTDPGDLAAVQASQGALLSARGQDAEAEALLTRALDALRPRLSDTDRESRSGAAVEGRESRSGAAVEGRESRSGAAVEGREARLLPLWRNLAVVQWRGGRLGAAEASLARAQRCLTAAAGSDEAVELWLLQAALAAEQSPGSPLAEAALRRAERLAPEEPAALLGLAALATWRGRLDDANALVQRAAPRAALGALGSAGGSVLLSLRARLAFLAGGSAGAEALLRQALASPTTLGGAMPEAALRAQLATLLLSEARTVGSAPERPGVRGDARRLEALTLLAPAFAALAEHGAQVLAAPLAPPWAQAAHELALNNLSAALLRAGAGPVPTATALALLRAQDAGALALELRAALPGVLTPGVAGPANLASPPSAAGARGPRGAAGEGTAAAGSTELALRELQRLQQRRALQRLSAWPQGLASGLLVHPEARGADGAALRGGLTARVNTLEAQLAARDPHLRALLQRRDLTDARLLRGALGSGGALLTLWRTTPPPGQGSEAPRPPAPRSAPRLHRAELARSVLALSAPPGAERGADAPLATSDPGRPERVEGRGSAGSPRAERGLLHGSGLAQPVAAPGERSARDAGGDALAPGARAAAARAAGALPPLRVSAPRPEGALVLRRGGKPLPPLRVQDPADPPRRAQAESALVLRRPESPPASGPAPTPPTALGLRGSAARPRGEGLAPPSTDAANPPGSAAGNLPPGAAAANPPSSATGNLPPASNAPAPRPDNAAAGPELALPSLSAAPPGLLPRPVQPGAERYTGLLLVSHGDSAEAWLLDLGEAQPVDDALGRFLREGQALRDPRDALAQLGRLLLPPLLPGLKGARKLFVRAPSDLLAAPFGALPLPDGRPLAVLLPVAVGLDLGDLLGGPRAAFAAATSPPSGRAAGAPSEPPLSPAPTGRNLRPLLVLGAPLREAAPRGLRVGTLFGGGGDPSKELPRELVELEGLLRQHRYDARGGPLFGLAATPARLLAWLPAAAVHLQAPLFLAEDLQAPALLDRQQALAQRLCRSAPLLCAPLLHAPPAPAPRAQAGLLLLAYQRSGPQQLSDDGQLTSERIAQLDLSQTALLTLSTAVPPGSPRVLGAGLAQLYRAARSAGARGVALSLWRPSEAGTLDLWRRLYGPWLRGADLPGALRRLQTESQQRGQPPQEWASILTLGGAAP